LAAIDDVQDDVGLVDGDLDLPLDVVAEVVGVDDADAAGIDELKVPVTGLQDGGDAVARDPGGGIDDGDAPAGQPVEQRGLPHVGPADDGDDGERHGETSNNGLPVETSYSSSLGNEVASRAIAS